MNIPKRSTTFHLLIFLLTAFAIVWFLPSSERETIQYEIGKPWAYGLITAPTDMPIYLDSARCKEIKDSVNRNFAPIIEIKNTTSDEIVKNVNESLANIEGFSASNRASVVATVKSIYSQGVISSRLASAIQSGRIKSLRTVKGNVTSEINAAGFYSPKTAYARIDSTFTASNFKDAFSQIGLSSLILPNIEIDTIASNKLSDEIYKKAIAPTGIIHEGERIIARGEIVTPQIYTNLQHYERILTERQSKAQTNGFYIFLGKIGFIILSLLLLFFYLRIFRPRLFASAKTTVFIYTLVAVFVIANYIISVHVGGGIYLIPFTIVPIVVLAFFDTRTALFVNIVSIVLSVVVANSQFEFLFMQLMAGVTAVFSLKDLTRRSQLLRTAVMVFIAYVTSYVAVELMLHGTIDDYIKRVLLFTGINSVLISFAYILIFIFEKIFRFTSVVTLVELADTNSKILQKLSEECPGTFQHSMTVSTLATDAARAIGANVQLVRTGALYHDIGKIENAAFFTENQKGVNPHNALDPISSAKIIIGHVTDGLKIANRENLPDPVKAFIAEHHGKGVAKYFFNTYCNAHPDEEVDPEPFSYPGPNPRSRETSILMMADSVEAASRSLKEFTVEAITALVNKLIDSQVDDGLHDDSNISFRDIKTIKEAFIRRLGTIYHARVAYPERIKQQASPTNE